MHLGQSAAALLPRGDLGRAEAALPESRKRRGATLPIVIPDGIEPRGGVFVGRQRELLAAGHEADEQEALPTGLVRPGEQQPGIAQRVEGDARQFRLRGRRGADLRSEAAQRATLANQAALSVVV
jgi:hypothetical protein